MNRPKTWQEAWKMIQDSVRGMEGVDVFNDCINVTGYNTRDAKKLVGAVNRKLKAEGLDYISLTSPEEKWHYIAFSDEVEQQFRLAEKIQGK